MMATCGGVDGIGTMFDGAHLKRRLGQYGAAWVVAFLVSGTAILIGMLFADLMVVADLVLPVMLAATVLALGVGVVASLVSDATLGTKLVVAALAVTLALPLLWSPVSAAVAIAFFVDRSIEYSQTYADFRISVSRLIYPLSEWAVGGEVFADLWLVFQGLASVVGFISALSNIWPLIRRVLGAEPGPRAAG